MSNEWKDNTTTAVLYPTEVKTTVLNIDSLFRENPQTSLSTDFLIRLPKTYKNVISIRMSSIEIPNTWYSFTAEHCETSFLFDGKRLMIPDGNYTPDTLVEHFESAVLNNTTSATFTATFSPSSGKITLDNSGNPFNLEFGSVFGDNSLNIRSSFTPYNAGLGYYMGLTSPAYSNNSTYVGEYIVNTLRDNYVYLQLLDLPGCIEGFSYGNTSITAFAKIVVNVDKNALIYDNGANTVTKAIQFPQPTNISTFRVRLIDAYGHIIRLMGDFSFTLEIQEVVSSKVYDVYRNNLTAG